MLGIFQRKKAENNKLILKSLVGGPKTTKQIAEYIYLNRKSRVRHLQPKINEVRKIVSIISRKRSRLDELKTKHYIERKNNLWDLTAPKGYAVALTLLDNAELVEAWHYIPKEDLSTFFKRLHAIPIIHNFLNDERIKKVEDFAKHREYLQHMRDCTIDLITQGVDLDRMTGQEFNVLLSSKLAYVLLRELLPDLHDQISDLFP